LACLARQGPRPGSRLVSQVWAQASQPAWLRSPVRYPAVRRTPAAQQIQ
jgi:hypothetical protein